MTYRLELILDCESRWIAEYPLSIYDINKARKWGNLKTLYKVVQKTVPEGLIKSTNGRPSIQNNVQTAIFQRKRGIIVNYPSRYEFIDGSILEIEENFELRITPPPIQK